MPNIILCSKDVVWQSVSSGWYTSGSMLWGTQLSNDVWHVGLAWESVFLCMARVTSYGYVAVVGLAENFIP
jgi:hypothetical protein